METVGQACRLNVTRAPMGMACELCNSSPIARQEEGELCRTHSDGSRMGFTLRRSSPDWKCPLEFLFQVLLENKGRHCTTWKLPLMISSLHECICCDRGLTFCECRSPMDLVTQAGKQREGVRERERERDASAFIHVNSVRI